MHLPIGQICTLFIVSLAGAAPRSEGGLSSSAAFPTGDIPRLSLQLGDAALAALQSHPRDYVVGVVGVGVIGEIEMVQNWP